MGYLTLSAAPDSVICRALFVPNSPEVLAIVRGAIEDLTSPASWSKFGALTPEQSAACFQDMFDRFCLEKDTCRMIGEIVAYAGAVSPKSQWLACDGSEVSIITYQDLYAVIGNAYGAASAGHFRLPDLQGRSPAGVGTGAGLPAVALGQKFGEAAHSLTVQEIPAHSHADTGHIHSIPSTTTFLALTGEEPVSIPIPLIPSWTGAASANIANTGGSGAHNNQSPSLGILYLIVAMDG